jgi:tetratricopeptide (TPR) repeat protein
LFERFHSPGQIITFEKTQRAMNSSFRFTVCISIILGSVLCVHAQNPVIDSLVRYVKSEKNDTLRIMAYHSLFDEYEFTDDQKASEVLMQAKKLSEKAGNRQLLADTYVLFGYLAEDKGDYPAALENYSRALKLNRETGDLQGTAIALNNIGVVHYEQGNYPEALKNYFESLKIKERIAAKNPDDSASRRNIAASYNNIGNVYYDQGNYTEALKNQTLALKLRESVNDRKTLASTYHNIGNIYYAQNNYQEALKQYEAARKINEELGNKIWLAKNYDAIGIIYDNQEKNGEALKNYTASLGTAEEIGDSADMALSLVHLGGFYSKQKNYASAKKYLSDGEKIALQIGYRDCLKELYKGLSYVDSARGDFRTAYEHHKLFVLYKDSLDNEETRKKTIQSQMNYDFEKREAVAEAEHKKEMENQSVLAYERSRKQRSLLVFVCCFLLLVLGFAAYIFRSLKLTQRQKKIIEEQKGTLEIQKREVEYQKMQIEEHRQNIIDSITYARRIQRSLLPTEKYIDRQLKRLRKNQRQIDPD